MNGKFLFCGVEYMKRITLLLAVIFLLISLIGAGCVDEDDDDTPSQTAENDDESVGDDDDNDDVTDDDDDSSDNDDDNNDNDDYWEPSSVAPIEVHDSVRDQLVIRGIIHLHSVYSHDACDNFPFINGHPNWICFDQLRESFCATNQQYIMLTDHAEPFSYHEYPGVLLYMEDRGDELIYMGEEPIGNLIHCEDGNDVILMAGNENRLMPVGMERMPEGDGDARRAFLRSSTAETVESMQDDLGATVIVNHAEDWTTEEIRALPVDGLEVYQLHANIGPGGPVAPPIAKLVLDILHYLIPYEAAGHSDLVLLTFLMENQIAIDHWDILLDERRMVGIAGTDAHRNSLPFPLYDGDRADSYRRMMRWFANYLLVEDYTLENIREAIATGRLFSMFQVFGEPIGFDYYADTAKGTHEMGEVLTVADSPTLQVNLPSFWNMDPTLPAPEFTLRIIQSGPTGGTVVAETTDEDLSYAVTESGAYRAEVKVTPYHLEPFLGDNADRFIKQFPLIYANAIYIED